MRAAESQDAHRGTVDGNSGPAQMVKPKAMALVLTLSTACNRPVVTDLPPKIYQAHGKAWTYRQSEIRTRNPMLASLHAGGNGYRERHSIESETGERIAVQDRLFALQRNGTYKKVACCEYFREQGELYSFEGRLVFVFENGREFITDCFIYPAGRPDNERKPKEDRVFGTTVYAVFDPERRVFLISEFDAGNFTLQEYQAANAGRSIESAARFAYRHRAPFICDKT